MFKIIGGDGKEYGPVTVDQLRQWVREGRASGQTSVRLENESGWRALSSLPELADIFNAPPAIGALPGGGGTMSGNVLDGDYELDIGGCISRAWAVLSADFWLMAGGCAIYLLIIGGISGLSVIPFIGTLFSIASLVVAGPLLGGVYYFVLRLQRGQRPEIGDVFAGFRDNLGQLILGHIIPGMLAGAAAIPGAVMVAVPAVIMAQNEAASTSLLAIAAAGVLISIVPLTYFSICWVFTLPLIMDKRLDFWTAMKVSRRQVGRHWWTVLGLAIIVGLINFVGVLVCCVGTFVTAPLAAGALMFAYENLFTPRAAHTSQGA